MWKWSVLHKQHVNELCVLLQFNGLPRVLARYFLWEFITYREIWHTAAKTHLWNLKCNQDRRGAESTWLVSMGLFICTQEFRMNLLFVGSLLSLLTLPAREKNLKNCRVSLPFSLGFILFTPSWESLFLHTTYLNDPVDWEFCRTPSVISEFTSNHLNILELSKQGYRTNSKCQFWAFLCKQLIKYFYLKYRASFFKDAFSIYSCALGVQSPAALLYAF